MNALLLELAHQYPTTSSPQHDRWKILKDDVDIDLDKWNPLAVEHDAVLIVVSNFINVHPSIANATDISNGSWTWCGTLMSFTVPDRHAILLESHSHILVVLHCLTKVKTSNKKKKVAETSHSILIPTTFKVHDLLRLVRADNVSGVFVENQEEDLRRSNLSASGLGWTHGTVLRLELW